MSTIEDLNKLSAAEDFFTYLGVPFDPAVVRVARLHILRRMGQYLKDAEFDGLDEAGVQALCREILARAYEDFVKSSPIQERLFKVHKEAVAPKPDLPKPFVPLAALTMPQEGN